MNLHYEKTLILKHEMAGFKAPVSSTITSTPLVNFVGGVGRE